MSDRLKFGMVRTQAKLQIKKCLKFENARLNFLLQAKLWTEVCLHKQYDELKTIFVISNV